MAPLKTSISRALRSKVGVQSPLARFGIQRGLTATAKTATTTTKPASSTAFPISDFQGGALIPNFTPSRPRTSHPQTNATSFNTLLNDITHSLSTTPSPSLPRLHALLRAYESNPDHWSRFAHANPDKQYTRNLVCEVPGIFNLLLLVWTPGKASPVHDHADSHCLMKILKGRIRETRFATPTYPGTEGPLVQTSRLEFGLNKVTYMADVLGLHSISNPHPTEYAVSLHLYTPPNAALRGCHIYDMESGDEKHVMQGAYDSVRGVVPPS